MRENKLQVTYTRTSIIERLTYVCYFWLFHHEKYCQTQPSSTNYCIIPTFLWCTCITPYLKVNFGKITPVTPEYLFQKSLYFRYPEKWYQDVTSGTRYYSLAAVHPHDGHIIGMIVCDVRTLNQINREVCTTVGTCISLEKQPDKDYYRLHNTNPNLKHN